MSRSEAKNIIEDNGGKILGTPSKKLDYLIVGDSKPTTKKIEQAKNNGVSILSEKAWYDMLDSCLLYTSPSPRDLSTSRMPSSA